MKAAYMYGAGDVRVDEVTDPEIVEPTDAIVRAVRACVCGSDLHPYHSMDADAEPRPMGHELVAVVEEVGADVRTVAVGDLVIVPFVYSDNTCVYCREGLQTSCVHGGFYGSGGVGGLQAQFARIPLADGTLVAVPDTDEHSVLLPSLLTLSDVYLTGYHAAVQGRVRAGHTVAVVGDGAVGLSAVLAARELGAERIILMGRHTSRTDLGVEFGATDVVAARGEQGIAEVREMTGGEGAHVVLEAVGHMPAYEQSVGIVRAGGTISRVGVPQYEMAPIGFASLFGSNVTLTGGVAPVRAYLEDAISRVLSGAIEPGKVFDEMFSLEQIPAAYAAMDERRVLKAMIAM